MFSVSRVGIGQLNRLDNGGLLWKGRLGESCWASPVRTRRFVYAPSKDGTTHVLKIVENPIEAAGDDDADVVTVVASNTLAIGEKTRVYGVAVSGDRLLFRTGNELLCVAAEAE